MAARKATRKATRRRSTARRSTTRKRSTARRSTTRRSTARRSTTRKRSTTKRTSTRRKAPRRTSTRRATAVSAPVRKSSKDQELAAMHLSILIVGVAGVILLFARPTPMMQKVVGVLLVILGLWGLMMKK
ncbi:hypothetical protein HOF78_02935 [Candidatus Woesearchaeota archaeon]|jgi:hypothetical protein|nr:hypothetical protein [Candidatus Woesearchaeota archaeon]MBT6044499.1 hypothetical protein [Candidatus Woesearchaeota archaeon]